MLKKLLIYIKNNNIYVLHLYHYSFEKGIFIQSAESAISVRKICQFMVIFSRYCNQTNSIDFSISLYILYTTKISLKCENEKYGSNIKNRVQLITYNQFSSIQAVEIAGL